MLFARQGSTFGSPPLLLRHWFLPVNIETPRAALDIKSIQGDGTKVLRLSTIPTSVDKTKEFVLFAGEKVDGGYNLRKINVEDLFSIVGVYIPSTKRIVVVNSTNQVLNQKGVSVDFKLDTEIFNSGDGDYRLDKATGEVEILKDGFYDVASWVGFEQLPIYEGDIVISLARKRSSENSFTNYKRTVVARIINNARYGVGNGVGGSFAFVDKFSAGDKLKLSAILEVEQVSVNTLPESVSLTVTRVDKDKVNIINP